MWLNIHLVSLGAGAGAVVNLTFLVFSLAYLLLVSHDRIFLRYMILQAAFLPYLVGYALYTSGSEPHWILLWYRVCITGLLLTPPALELFLASLLNKQRRLYLLVMGSGVVILLALLWIVPESMATGQILLYEGKGFISVEKGPLYSLAVVFVFLAVVSSVGIFCYRLFINPGGRWRNNGIILAGLSIWFLAGVFDALAAFHILNTVNVPWLGPVVMVIALGVHMGGLVERRFRSLRRQMEENQLLRYRLKFDPLTDLYSREFFNSFLELEAESWDRKPTEHSILFIDADNFKGINDRYGHTAGDTVLKSIGTIIRENVRRADIPSRYGGDEFIILLKECSEDSARLLAEKMIRDYALTLHRIFPDLPDGFSGLSIGIASTRLWKDERIDLIASADEAMYSSKRRGKNRVIVADKAV